MRQRLLIGNGSKEASVTRLLLPFSLPRALLASCIAVVACLPVGALAGTGPGELLVGKEKTGRSIALEALVDGTPEQIFEAWVTAEGVGQFFGSGSHIEPRVGGLYEIDFGQLPDGTVLGPRGNRILRYEPARVLDFEWGMPIFARELNTRPLPTWVEIRFEPFGEGKDRTLIKLTHHGFGQGDLWDRCFSFFQRGWFDILFRLKLYRSFFVFSS